MCRDERRIEVWRGRSLQRSPRRPMMELTQPFSVRSNSRRSRAQRCRNQWSRRPSVTCVKLNAQWALPKGCGLRAARDGVASVADGAAALTRIESPTQIARMDSNRVDGPELGHDLERVTHRGQFSLGLHGHALLHKDRFRFGLLM